MGHRGGVRNNVTLADLTASCRTSMLLVDSKLRDPDHHLNLRSLVVMYMKEMEFVGTIIVDCRGASTDEGRSWNESTAPMTCCIKCRRFGVVRSQIACH